MTKQVNWEKIKNCKILVVDDASSMLDMICQMLCQLGCRASFRATNGEDALKTHKDHQIDITFLDIEMPDLCGLSVLKKLKEEDQSKYVVILSGHNKIDYVQEAIKSGANGYIVKPCSINKMSDNLIKFAKSQGWYLS